MTAGFRSVAVVVRDHAGWPAAAVAVTWQATAAHDDPDDARDAAGFEPEASARGAELSALASAAAADLARRIGGH